MPTYPIFSRLRLAGWAGLLGLATGCVDSYIPDVIPSSASFLVVDGFINGNGRTRVRLTRTQNLTATTTPQPLRGAIIYIVDDAGLRYQVREGATTGLPYTSDSLQLNPARRYKLRITLGTAGNAPVYESDLTALKVSPGFDQLGLARQGDQVELSVSTHDATSQTRYYRWRAIETWEFNAAFRSYLEVRLNTDIVRARTTPIYTCYRTEIPSTIRQVSTASLSQDVVNNQLLLTRSDRDERYKVRYSVLVLQYAETPEEFKYYEILRKNTEAIGTINDPLPSQLTGNVHRISDPNEPVLGFVGAHTVVQRRLFATPTSLGYPQGWDFTPPYKCKADTERVPNPLDKYPIFRPHTRLFAAPDNVPTEYAIVGNADTIGYVGAVRECVDCRVRGTTTKPSFW